MTQMHSNRTLLKPFMARNGFMIDGGGLQLGKDTLLQLADSIEIHNNPYMGYRFAMRIYKTGVVRYKNNIDSDSEAVLVIMPVTVKHILDSIIREMPCLDDANQGTPVIDGYHWRIVLYKDNEIIHKAEGWPNEEYMRYEAVKRIIATAEQGIHKDLGYANMNFHR